MTRPIWLAAVGDANDPATFGGTPFHVLQAGRRAGAITGGLALDVRGRGWRLRRLLWNTGEMLRSGHRGGYQYTDAFQTRLWRGARHGLRGTGVVNFFQLYPDAVFADDGIDKWFYIDQTLAQLYEDYGIGGRISPRIAARAVERERDQYHRARGVICDTEWAARSVREDYGVPPAHVHVVVGGGNIDADAAERSDRRECDTARPVDDELRVAFVGKDWRRKGLGRLLRATRAARRRGAAIRVVVIGPRSEDVPADSAHEPGIEWAGFVDKAKDPLAFVDRVGGCDVGVLLSHAEAGGRSLREFVRLGLPTIAPDVGGSPEFVIDGATHLVPPDAPDEAVADILYRLATDRELLAAQKRVAWAARRTASWDHAVRRIADIVHAHE